MKIWCTYCLNWTSAQKLNQGLALNLTWLDLILILFFIYCGCPSSWDRQQAANTSNCLVLPWIEGLFLFYKVLLIFLGEHYDNGPAAAPLTSALLVTYKCCTPGTDPGQSFYPDTNENSHNLKPWAPTWEAVTTNINVNGLTQPGTESWPSTSQADTFPTGAMQLSA